MHCTFRDVLHCTFGKGVAMYFQRGVALYVQSVSHQCCFGKGVALYSQFISKICIAFLVIFLHLLFCISSFLLTDIVLHFQVLFNRCCVALTASD